MDSHILYFSMPNIASSVHSMFAIFLHFPLSGIDFDFVYALGLHSGWKLVFRESSYSKELELLLLHNQSMYNTEI